MSPNYIKSNVNSSQVNGEVFDLDRVLEGDCTLEFLKFEDDEGKLGLLLIANFTTVFIILFLIYYVLANRLCQVRTVHRLLELFSVRNKTCLCGSCFL